MTDSEERVSLELIDAGDHKDRVVQLLSKVKGLELGPEQIVNSAPCTIAANIPRSLAEKLQTFLEKTGAMVMIEGGEELFTPDGLPTPEEEPQETVEPEEESPASEEEDEWQFEAATGGELDELTPDGSAAGPSDDFGGFSAAVVGGSTEDEEEFEDEEEELELEEEEEKEPGKLQKILSKIKLPKKEKKAKKEKAEKKPEKEKKKFSFPGLSKFRKSETEEPDAETAVAEETENPELADKEKKKFSFPGRSKFRKSKTEELTEETDVEEEIENPELSDEEKDEVTQEKVPASLMSRLVPAIIGFLAGAVIMGGLGWTLMRSQQANYNEKLSAQLKKQGIQVRAELQQREQAFEALQKQNDELTRQSETFIQQQSELTGQLETLKTELEEARAVRSIEPSAMQGIGMLTPGQETIVKEFQALKDIHANSLDNGYDAQKQASCSRQLLLDGKGTMIYAQVVKKFTARFTTLDVIKSDSLITPYIAEFKIPFQQEIRTGKNAKACNKAKIQQMPTPAHHEFGTFYGFWIIQYVYKDGKWIAKPTVLETNRALYESAFKLGSPEYAKFLINTQLFPEFIN